MWWCTESASLDVREAHCARRWKRLGRRVGTGVGLENRREGTKEGWARECRAGLLRMPTSVGVSSSEVEHVVSVARGLDFHQRCWEKIGAKKLAEGIHGE